MSATKGMKGAGYYDKHSGTQRSAISALQSWIDDAVADLPLPDSSQPIVVLDLGSSEGRNAIQLMETVVAGLRRRTDQDIETIYNDLASNDFNQLFANLEEARLGGRLGADIYPSVVAASFYNPLLPPGTVHLATSFNALNWLSRLPAVPLTDSIAYQRPLSTRTVPTSSPEATVAFTHQAEQDLVRFLECRARELAPGAKLLIATPADTDEIRMCDGLWAVLNDASIDLVAEGGLEREEYELITMPTYCRTVAEFLAPLEREECSVRDAFTVDRAETLEVSPPSTIQFRRDGDATAYADAYLGFLRAISEPVVRAALNRPTGEDETVDRLFGHVRARLVAEPERYQWHYNLAVVLLTRR